MEKKSWGMKRGLSRLTRKIEIPAVRRKRTKSVTRQTRCLPDKRKERERQSFFQESKDEKRSG